MNKKALILLSCIISLFSTLLVPFSISAYDHGEQIVINDHIVGFNINYVQYDGEHYSSGNKTYAINTSGNTPISFNLSNLDNTSQIYMVNSVEVLFDDYYIGYIQVSYSGGYAKQVYVNSNKAEISVNMQIYNFSVTGGTLYSYSTDDMIWNYPIESFNICSYMLNSLPERYSGINSYNDYMFPIFKIKQNDIVYKTNVAANDNWTQTFIFYLNDSINGANSFSNYFSIDRGEVLSYRQLNRFFFDGRIGYLCQVTIGNFTSSGVLNIKYINSNDRYYMPIYCNAKVYNENVSTDFALIFGLSNRLLNNLDKIDLLVNGNSSTNQSSNRADQMSSNLQSSIEQENQAVDNAESNLQTDLNNLDIQNQNNNLFGNSKFITSANWVRTQFNSLTTNNAFGYLITFSLAIGLSLVIVGKLRG